MALYLYKISYLCRLILSIGSFFMKSNNRLNPDYIFETSWEVCNKVGGIYTVLSTRAKTLQDKFKDKIIFIGPDCNNNPDFMENANLFKDWKKFAAESEKLKIRIGRWNVPGKPVAILIDFSDFFSQKDRIYFRMWEKFGVKSMNAYGDYDESCMFAHATGVVIESFYKFYKLENSNVIAHFNEWMLGMGALYLQDNVPAIATVFTTHATSIGRSIAGNNKALYAYFNGYNGDQMAEELNMEAKHSVEKQTALHVDAFTTVSDITACECAQLLDKIPDVVTPNGFEDNFVPKGRTYTQKRNVAREKLLEVTEKLTGSKIKEDALLLAISGRYEYKNKGIDVFIEAMNRIRNHSQESKKQVIAFILVPAWAKSARKDLQNRLQNNDNTNSPLPNPYLTHELYEPQNDKVCGYLQYLDFINKPEDHVKIIFVPSYLNGDDGIFNLSYYDILPGMDLTVFPSYYEPWGYTPLESIAFGVPTITTDLAGFGLWAEKEGAFMNLLQGVNVVTRNDENYFEVAENIKNSIIKYTYLSSSEVATARDAASVLSEKAAWSHFIEYYYETYDLALRKAQSRNKSGNKPAKNINSKKNKIITV